jgi:hypothetical protein
VNPRFCYYSRVLSLLSTVVQSKVGDSVYTFTRDYDYLHVLVQMGNVVARPDENPPSEKGGESLGANSFLNDAAALRLFNCVNPNYDGDSLTITCGPSDAGIQVKPVTRTNSSSGTVR